MNSVILLDFHTNLVQLFREELKITYFQINCALFLTAEHVFADLAIMMNENIFNRVASCLILKSTKMATLLTPTRICLYT